MTDQPIHTGAVDVALSIGVDPNTLRKDLRDGRLQADRYGDRWLFTDAQITAAREFYAARRAARSG